MAGRMVVFGATGYTGELVARALVGRGHRPVLAARSGDRLERLAEELGGLQTEIADATRPESVRALVERGDVLVSTVGPFLRWGTPAIEAAVDAGAHYLDSTGEPDFIRRAFEQYGPSARRNGSALLTAFGFDWVPGNLAAALALAEAGPEAVRVEVGYLSLGGAGRSGGTRASSVDALLAPSFAFRGGRLRAERGGARARQVDFGSGQRRWALSIGGSEHFALPALHPTLRDVDVLLVAADPKVTRALPVLSLVVATVTRVPPLRAGLLSLVRRRVSGSTGGPDATARAGSSAVVVAEAFSPSGKVMRRVRLAGVNPYTFTGEIMAWGAQTLAAGGARGAGALGPVEAFGLDELQAGVRSAGLEQT
ncbi:trans-acting enoyl reductase family protein [Frankia sp. R82]|uniref:saccharopine dehydrogenase family protein n=1 Tax=Frankia sp. R82 TaxID=2950553 RepID=UPI0020438E26|nr:saccharopine dehydrogenase NADP-binding domain-containing protein [Frankia sp. R82]MCM3885699.1 saccharopine dehydrogenase NADP-binding domain-containing protein [Frankia sp. R82]